MTVVRGVWGLLLIWRPAGSSWVETGFLINPETSCYMVHGDIYNTRSLCQNSNMYLNHPDKHHHRTFPSWLSDLRDTITHLVCSLAAVTLLAA